MEAIQAQADTLTVESIARVCHEANRAYCAAIGDDSRKPWTEAEQWQRDSAIKGVEFARSGESTPEAQHKMWFAQKVADGWSYGPTKDPIAKTHPCMVPYRELPKDQQRKDALFRAVVSALKS